MAQTQGGITIDNGIITMHGEQIGTVMQELKRGYHPAIAIRFVDTPHVEWVELDERDRIAKIWVIVRKHVESREALMQKAGWK